MYLVSQVRVLTAASLHSLNTGDTMGYHIDYPAEGKRYLRICRTFRLPCLTLLSFLLFLQLVRVFWPEGAAWIRQGLLFLENSAAVSALNDLTEALHCGESPVEAFSDFCGKMIS